VARRPKLQQRLTEMVRQPAADALAEAEEQQIL
jgi:hypothetical protein